MRRVIDKFLTYGRQDAPDSGLTFGGDAVGDTTANGSRS
jgi:hypothetical protein